MIPSSWHCWEITKCEGSEGCPARQAADTPCWEIARELDDYRAALNVCKDCIVYISKQGTSTLAEDEIDSILERKGVCVLMSSCPRYVAPLADGGTPKAG